MAIHRASPDVEIIAIRAGLSGLREASEGFRSRRFSGRRPARELAGNSG